jgi:hypothetical protein
VVVPPHCSHGFRRDGQPKCITHFLLFRF